MELIDNKSKILSEDLSVEIKKGLLILVVKKEIMHKALKSSLPSLDKVI